MHHDVLCHGGVVSQPLLTVPQREPTPMLTPGGRTAIALDPGAGQLAAQRLSVPALAEGGQRPALPEPPWFEQMMPGPKTDIADQLLPDTWLQGTSTSMPLTQATWQREVDRRIAMEAQGKGDDYTFEPLLVLLENMRRLIGHLLANQHFDDPLTPDEQDALQDLGQLVQQMKDLEAPYKRTVWLAVLMSTVLEIMTAVRVVDGLRSRKSPLLAQGRLSTSIFMSGGDKKGQGTLLEPGSISLKRVLSCRWAGLNPAGTLDETQELFSGSGQLTGQLSDWINTPNLFLCPSFEPLDLPDFCRFGHLPVYPLGLMTRYALNADGVMHTPLSFLRHDLGHVSQSDAWKRLGSPLPLDSPASFAAFRSCVLDGLPAALKALGVEKAVVLIVFYLCHEAGVPAGRELLQSRYFLPLFHSICGLRRIRAFDLPGVYRAITDSQAVVACQWVYWMYHHYCRHQGASASESDRAYWAEQFVASQLPGVLRDQAFFERHREAIQAWCVAREEVTPSRHGHHGGRLHCIQSENAWAWQHFEDGKLIFLQDYHVHCEGLVDDTDLAYWDQLCSPGGREQLMQALGPNPIAAELVDEHSCPREDEGTFSSTAET